MKAIERDAQRARKQALLEASLNAADNYERYIQFHTSAHRVAFVQHDWVGLAAVAPPADPVRRDSFEKTALEVLNNYNPGWFARTFGGAKRKQAELSDGIEKAKVTDEGLHAEAIENVGRRRAEINFAKTLLSGDGEAAKTALSGHADFGAVGVEALRFVFSDDRTIAIANGFELDDLPGSSVTQLKSGKASVKPLSGRRLRELHRDNVCSSAIRIAVEALKALPLESIDVVVQSDVLDRGSGHIEARPVFYCRFAAQALSSVNLTRVEPAPAAEHLGAHFDYSARDGMRPIDISQFGLSDGIFDSNEPDTPQTPDGNAA
jgi:hypothetical protein